MTFFKRTFGAKNAGRARYAQQELDYQVSKANSQTAEAMAVDAVELTYWKKTDEGNFCTCGFGLNHPQNPGVSNQLVFDQPVATTPPEQSLPETKTTPRVVVKNAWGDDIVKPDDGGPQAPTDYKVNNQTIKPQATYDDDGFLNAPEGFNLLTGGEGTQCGICLGAGKTNAWGLWGGQRVILDSYTVDSRHGFTQQTDTRPVSFRSTQDSRNYVQWVYPLPTYFKKALSVSVRNNTLSVRDLHLFYQKNGTQDPWQVLTPEILQSFNGTPTILNLRVAPAFNALQGDLVFTHIEISWQFSVFIHSQMDKLQTATNQQIRDTITTASFILPPNVEEITKNDVFYDNKYGRMWSITDFSDNLTAQRRVMEWSISARSMQPYEQKSLLQIAHNRFYQVAFSGLSPFEFDFRDPV